MGQLGELIVVNYLKEKGQNVELSNDKYDSVRDIFLNGKNLEVKTQVPLYSKKAFSIRENQLPKCINADYVAFVAVPSDRERSVMDGKVFMIGRKDFKVQKFTTKDNRKMLLIPFDTPGLTEIFKIKEEDIQKLKTVSSSGWVND